MNILFLINYAGKGGTEKYIITMTKFLKTRNCNIFLIYNEKGELCSRMNKLGVSPVQMEMKNPFDIKTAKKVAHFCSKNKIDIIHTQFQRENYISLIAKMFYKNIKVIYTSHINLKNNIVWKTTNLFMCRNNDAIIAVCTEGKNLLICNNMPKNKIKVIFNGVDYEKCKKHENNKGLDIRREFDICENEFVFVTLTRFTSEKGTRYLLQSIKQLKQNWDKPFKVIIAGDGILLDEDKKFAEENNIMQNVVFAGFRDDSNDILDAGDAYINSSQSEALSFAILEAMAKGMPIIATELGGNIDIVNEKTNCGLLAQYDNPKSMSDCMAKLMSDKDFFNKCSENSLKTVKEVFDINKKLEETYEIYKILIQGDNLKC